MKIIYGYSNCSDKKYNELMDGKDIAILRPSQKYHGLLIKGLAKNGAYVECLSGLPINREVTKKILVCEKDEQEENIHHHYYTTLNLPILRHIMIFFGALINCLKTKKEKDTFAICDCLNTANSYGMAIACKIRKIPIVTIVTDLPDMLFGNRIIRTISNNVFGMFSGYIFLTKQMNERINRENKPYTVLEGHVDSSAGMQNINEKYENSGKKVIIYAGAVQKLYGLKELADGFTMAGVADCELWIFGDGDYRQELEKSTNKNIKYMGVRSNREVVAHEQRAALLINPRPNSEEYTKYSFPSKNMEYMVSGTPVMTTKLPGMPDEYLPYVYAIENGNAEEIAKGITRFFNEPLPDRTKKGEAAKRFVLENKSNIVQAGKIIDFLKTV